MSSMSDNQTCPNCGRQMSCSTSNRPYLYTTGNCLHCGFYYLINADFINLDELNGDRNENSMKPLEKLPEQQRHLVVG